MSNGQGLSVFKVSSACLHAGMPVSALVDLPSRKRNGQDESDKAVFVVGRCLNDKIGTLTGGPTLTPFVDARKRLRPPYVDELAHRTSTLGAQAQLFASFVDALAGLQTPIVPLFVTRSDWIDQYRYERFRDLVWLALGNGYVPIVFPNELFAESEEQDCDHDQLACLVAIALKADNAVFLHAERELFDSESGIDYGQLGSVVELALIRQPTNLAAASKLEAAKILSGFGIPLQLLPCNDQTSRLGDVDAAETHCTRVVPRGKRLNQMKSWIAMSTASKGELDVSTFLADNLRGGRAASILAIGVEAIRGTFAEGDIVTVKDTDGQILGRGRSRISSVDLENFVGGLKGNRVGTEANSVIVIHYDYFVPDPTIGFR